MNETFNKGRATYKTMAASTKDDWAIISDYAKDFNQNLSNMKHRIRRVESRIKHLWAQK